MAGCPCATGAACVSWILDRVGGGEHDLFTGSNGQSERDYAVPDFHRHVPHVSVLAALD